MKKLSIMLSLVLLLSQAACLKSGSKSDKTGQLLGATVVYLSSIWQKVTAADVDPNFTYPASGGLAPGCACPPSLEATTGKRASYNPDFAFFVKPGTNNNLLIFFMGGGACWDITNCAYNHTYSPELMESNLLLGLGVKGALDSYGVGGIMDMSNPYNPFKDWTIVWVPYCTGDLGMGQQNYTYTDEYRDHVTTPDPVYPGDQVTIRHRGRVNLELVIQWLRTNITTQPTKLFVTGSSAGSYAAMLSFPLIRDLYGTGSTTAYVLGDAGEGPAPPNPTPFIQLVAPIWGLELPLSTTVFGGKSITDYSEYKEIVQDMVTYYKDNYPNDRFAQYTTKWDKTQIWFYNIQKGDNILHPELWGAERNAAADPTSAIAIEWHDGMMDAIDITGANYWYYIGPGTHHTIDLLSQFYTETSAGMYFFDWVTAFVSDEPMSDRICDDPTVCNVP